MTLIADLNAALGSDIVAFLEAVGVTTSGANITGWSDANGSGAALVPNGTVPYTAGVGLTFDSTAYMTPFVNFFPIANQDNWALIAVVNPTILAATNPIAISIGTTGGVALMLSPAGALIESIAEDSMSSGPLTAAMQVLTLQRLAGSMSLRINGVGTGVGAVGTAPTSMAAGVANIGWTGVDHDKLNGVLRAGIFVPTHPGATGMSTAEAALMTAYGIGVTAPPGVFHRSSIRRR